MANIYHILGVVCVSILLVVGLGYWADQRSSTPEIELRNTEEFDGPLSLEETDVINPTNINPMNPIAIFNTNQGTFELELFEDLMPITVDNFIKLAESGFYDQTKFHRVIERFMIQGGDPNSKTNDEDIYGQGGPDKNVPDEFVTDELLTNTRGTISMANTGQPNSGGSQFFINLVDNTGLDFDKEPLSSKHPVFGRVIKGIEVVDKIGRVETKERDIPVDPVVIERIEIVRK